MICYVYNIPFYHSDHCILFFCCCCKSHDRVSLVFSCIEVLNFSTAFLFLHFNLSGRFVLLCLFNFIIYNSLFPPFHYLIPNIVIFFPTLHFYVFYFFYLIFTSSYNQDISCNAHCNVILKQNNNFQLFFFFA